MHMRSRSLSGMLALAIAALVLGAHDGSAKPRSAPYAPHIDPSVFKVGVDHAYFPLVPGTRYVYRETDGSRVSEDVQTVLPETKMVLGVTCTVVHDVLTTKGKLHEDTYDWYAQDNEGNVWYFGEDTKEYDSKGRADTEGSWEAGVKGAQPGIIMKAQVAKSEPYRQEYRRGHAEDMGQILGVGDSVTVPAGSYPDCVYTKEWSMLESGHEFKWYAKGVGFVRSQSAAKEVCELLSVTHP